MADVGRQRLDQHLAETSVPPRPTAGWVRAIRDALGMSGAQLAERMGVAPQRIPQIEQAERDHRLQLNTLRRAAEALGCRLEYVLVPDGSLEELVERRAREKARQLVERSSADMRLENQRVSGDAARNQVDELADELADAGGLWADP